MSPHKNGIRIHPTVSLIVLAVSRAVDWCSHLSKSLRLGTSPVSYIIIYLHFYMHFRPSALPAITANHIGTHSIHPTMHSIHQNKVTSRHEGWREEWNFLHISFCALPAFFPSIWHDLMYLKQSSITLWWPKVERQCDYASPQLVGANLEVTSAKEFESNDEFILYMYISCQNKTTRRPKHLQYCLNHQVTILS